jgi:DNA segregation ATPase FtsK/SpoIIIE, S-DNA-T family
VIEMAKRNKKKRPDKNHSNDIQGIILITIGIIMIFSIFNSSSGILVSFIQRVVFAFFGIGTFILPLFIIFIGICFIAKKGQVTFNKKFYGILLFILNTMLLVQMINMPIYYETNNFMLGISKLYNYKDIFHGGIFSYIIDVPLYTLLGSTACYLVFTATYIISTILIFNVNLYDIILILKPVTNKTNDAILDEPNELSTDLGKHSVKEADDPENQNGNFISTLNKKIKIIDFMKNAKIEDENKEQPIDKIDIELHTFQENSKHKDTEVKEAINRELNEKIIQSSTSKVKEYERPSSELLNINNLLKMNRDDKKDLLNNASRLEDTLSSFGVEAKVIQVTKGPSVTRYELQPHSGVKVSKIVNLSDDIALGLAARGVRIEAPIPGKSAVGIEVPNKELTPVYLREVIESDEFINSKKNLAFCLGKDIAGNCVVSDLSKMPHMLIAGATGSGKSVCINTLIISLLYKYSPDNVKLLMVDPKVVELNVYNGIPHLLIPVVTDPKKAAGALNWAVNEMTRRYKLFAENGVRNIESYNELFSKGKISEKLPWIVIIVDELADLMMVCPNDIEDYIGRLAQMARAAGMHLVIATQRPSVDVITGVIKANIPSRISFAVSSQIDSRTILDSSGAEKLLGKGDMLFYPVGEVKPIRIQGAFISEEEVEKVVGFIKSQQNNHEYRTEILEQINTSASEGENERDELLDEAIRIVVESDQASTSLIQRRLRIGYNRAARIMEQLESNGIISGRDGSKPRQILVDKSEYMDNNYENENLQ